MNTKDKGNIAEAKVLSYLIEHGFGVAIPFGDNLPFDLICITKSFKCIKLQIKFVSIRKDTGTFSLKNERISNNTKNINTKIYSSSEVDIFAVYNPDTNNIYFIPFSDIKDVSKPTFRITPPKNNRYDNIRWHEDYLVLNAD